MVFDYSRISAFVIGALAVYLVYRRLRANFGPQPLRPVRMGIRIALLLLIAAMLLPLAAQSPRFLLVQTLGAGLGAALGTWGARRTRYRREGGRLYYQPHAYAGMAISALVVGRLVYRAIEWYSMQGMHVAPDSAPESPTAQMARSPLTVGLLFVLVGYYACYYGAVLWKSKRISPEDLEMDDTSTVAASRRTDALPADSNRL